MQLQKGAC